MSDQRPDLSDETGWQMISDFKRPRTVHSPYRYSVDKPEEDSILVWDTATETWRTAARCNGGWVWLVNHTDGLWSDASFEFWIVFPGDPRAD